MGTTARMIVILLLSGLLWSVSAPASASDEYIAGYASGILQHEFGITDAFVEVRNGEVVVTTKSLATIDRGKVVADGPKSGVLEALMGGRVQARE